MSGRLGSPEKFGTACWKCENHFGQSTGCLCGLCYNCVLNCGFGCCEAGNSHEFRFKGIGTDVDKGAVQGQPTKNSPDFRVGQKTSM